MLELLKRDSKMKEVVFIFTATKMSVGAGAVALWIKQSLWMWEDCIQISKNFMQKLGERGSLPGILVCEMQRRETRRANWLATLAEPAEPASSSFSERPPFNI